VADTQAPDQFEVEMETTKGTIKLEARRDWAPRGVDRFYELVTEGFFEDIAFFRVLDGFVAQFGIHGDPGVSSSWRSRSIEDDPVTQSNKRGTLTFAMAGPNTRTTQFFINLVDNDRLDSMGFSPVARVTDGMQVVDELYSGYGEGAPRGNGPDQGRIQKEGNAYLKKDFPELDYVKSARVV